MEATGLRDNTVDGRTASEFAIHGRQLMAAVIESFGGVYRARGGKLEILEDDLWKPSRIVVIEFPSMERALTCLRSPEYLKVRPIRHANAKATVVVVEGM